MQKMGARNMVELVWLCMGAVYQRARHLHRRDGNESSYEGRGAEAEAEAEEFECRRNFTFKRRN